MKRFMPKNHCSTPNGKTPQFSRTGIIILAGGNSSRMGQCKFLMHLPDGKTFLGSLTEQAQSLFANNMIVVIQSKYYHMLESGRDFAGSSAVQFVYNDYPERERFYSLKLGLNAFKDKVDYCFVHNADNPFLPEEVLYTLFEHRDEAESISPAYRGRGGHPVLIGKKTMQRLKECPDDAVLKNELAKKTHLRIAVTDPRICTDIDTPEDYLKLNVLEKHF